MDSNIKFVGKCQLKKTFNNPEEFNKYYMKHKEEIDSKTSNRLNKEYKINGFKITKRNVKVVDGKKQGELFLKPLLGGNDVISDNINDQLEERISCLETKINILTESYTHIIDVLNSLTSAPMETSTF